MLFGKKRKTGRTRPRVYSLKRKPKNRRVRKKSKKSKYFIAKAVSRMKAKRTLGSFTRWCKSRGLLNKKGKVTLRLVCALKIRIYAVKQN